MIRRYKKRDTQQILNVWYSASLAAHAFLDDQFFEKERVNIADIYLPNADTWVYEKEGKVIGFLAMIGNEIGGLFVDAAHHGTGIGRALMDHAMSLHDVLELNVFEKNRLGRRFYEKCGFTFMRKVMHEDTGFTQLRLQYVKEMGGDTTK